MLHSKILSIFIVSHSSPSPSSYPLFITVQRFTVNVLVYMLPPAYAFAAFFFFLRRIWGPAWRPPRIYYYILALFVGGTHIWWFYTIAGMWKEPTFSLSFDLFGEITRGLLFTNHMGILLMTLLEIYCTSAERGLPSNRMWLYFFLAFIGTHSSLLCRSSSFALLLHFCCFRVQLVSWVFLPMRR